MGLLAPRRALRHAVTAASRPPEGRLKGSTPPGTAGTLAQTWQHDAWAFFDTIGALKYASRFVGHALSRIRLYPTVVPDDGAEPVSIEQLLDPGDDTPMPAGIDAALCQQAVVELARLRSQIDGQSGLLRDFGINLTVAGDAYLVAIPNDNPLIPDTETWNVYSVLELIRRGQDRQGRPLWALVGSTTNLPEGSVAYRIYQPHQQRRNLADAPVRGILDDLEELALLNRSIRSTAKSRIAGAGMLLVPDELGLRRVDPDDPDSPEQLTVDLMKHLTAPLENEASASNVVPHLLYGNTDALKEVRHLVFQRPLDPQMAEQRKEKLTAIAIGLDLPPEVITGVAAANHWSAWQVDESTFKSHIEPLIILISSQLGALVLRELLAASNRWNPQQLARIGVGYDPSALVDHPDQSADALKLHAAFELSGAALRKYSHFTKEDAPDGNEIAARVERERLIHARGAPVEAIPPQDVSGPGENPQTQPGPPPKGPPPADKPPGSGTAPAPAARTASAMVAAAGRPVGHRLADLDLALYARVHGMCQTAVRRQLERAGAQITSKAQRNKPVLEQAKAAPKHAVAAALGRPVVADLGLADDQLTGDFTDLLDQVDTQVDRTRKAGLAAVLAFLAGHGQAPDAAQLVEYDMAAQRAQRDGRLRLQEGLSAFTLEQLYQPDPQADDRGEGVEAGDVPPGLVRNALAVYGGQQVDELGQPVDDGPIRGVAGGSDNLTVGASLGIVTDVWEWVHGAAIHPFPPHLDLDGQVFSDSDSGDTRRANVDDAWLGQPDYQIGDHQGCTCYALPLLDYSGSGDGS